MAPHGAVLTTRRVNEHKEPGMAPTRCSAQTAAVGPQSGDKQGTGVRVEGYRGQATGQHLQPETHATLGMPTSSHTFGVDQTGSAEGPLGHMTEG